MIPQWPGQSMVRDELGQMPRRRAFAEAHPGTEWDHVGAFHVGHVPYVNEGEEQSITIKARSWTGLLDALETYFEEDGPDTG